MFDLFQVFDEVREFVKEIGAAPPEAHCEDPSGDSVDSGDVQLPEADLTDSGAGSQDAAADTPAQEAIPESETPAQEAVPQPQADGAGWQSTVIRKDTVTIKKKSDQGMDGKSLGRGKLYKPPAWMILADDDIFIDEYGRMYANEGTEESGGEDVLEKKLSEVKTELFEKMEASAKRLQGPGEGVNREQLFVGEDDRLSRQKRYEDQLRRTILEEERLENEGRLSKEADMPLSSNNPQKDAIAAPSGDKSSNTGGHSAELEDLADLALDGACENPVTNTEDCGGERMAVHQAVEAEAEYPGIIDLDTWDTEGSEDKLSSGTDQLEFTANDGSDSSDRSREDDSLAADTDAMHRQSEHLSPYPAEDHSDDSQNSEELLNEGQDLQNELGGKKDNLQYLDLVLGELANDEKDVGSDQLHKKPFDDEKKPVENSVRNINDPADSSHRTQPEHRDDIKPPL